LWSREIRTQVVSHTRMYFVNEATEELSKAMEGGQSKRKRGRPELNEGFSSVGVLMPGRKPSAKGKRRSTKAPAILRAKEKKAGVG
jgi:hypothetical protein